MNSSAEKVWNEILTFLAILFLIIFSYPAFDVEISNSTETALNNLQIIIWAIFALDLFYGIWRSENRILYIEKHPLEVASVALPFLRPLRLLRVISFAGLAIQKIAIGRQFAITLKVALTILFITYISAVQITILERSSESSNIKHFGDGLWWAITTVTTVGYGDKYPITTEGRIIGAILMTTGVGIFGTFTAIVSSWFIQKNED